MKFNHLQKNILLFSLLSLFFPACKDEVSKVSDQSDQNDIFTVSSNSTEFTPVSDQSDQNDIFTVSSNSREFTPGADEFQKVLEKKLDEAASQKKREYEALLRSKKKDIDWSRKEIEEELESEVLFLFRISREIILASQALFTLPWIQKKASEKDSLLFERGSSFTSGLSSELSKYFENSSFQPKVAFFKNSKDQMILKKLIKNVLTNNFFIHIKDFADTKSDLFNSLETQRRAFSEEDQLELLKKIKEFHATGTTETGDTIKPSLAALITKHKRNLADMAYIESLINSFLTSAFPSLFKTLREEGTLSEEAYGRALKRFFGVSNSF